MSGIGFSELIILFVIGLIVLGPERLPRVANQLGSWLGQARRMTRVMKRQLEDELNLEKEFSIDSPPNYVPNKDDTYSPAHVVEENHAPAEKADKSDDADPDDSKKDA